MFGPKQNPDSAYSAVIPKFIKSFLRDEKPVIFGDGNQSRDFTFVDNVVSANLLAVKSEKGLGEVFNIACEGETSLNELIKLLKEISRKNIEPEYKETRVGDVVYSRADISKAKELLNYEPLVDIKEGLKKTFHWYEES